MKVKRRLKKSKYYEVTNSSHASNNIFTVLFMDDIYELLKL